MNKQLKLSDERCRGLICIYCGGPCEEIGPHNYRLEDWPFSSDTMGVGFEQTAIFDKHISTTHPVDFEDNLSRPVHGACWAHNRIYGRVEPFGSDKGHRAWT